MLVGDCLQSMYISCYTNIETNLEILHTQPKVPAIIFVFLSCRPFVAITTLSTGLVGVEVTFVSWLGQLTVPINLLIGAKT